MKNNNKPREVGKILISNRKIVKEIKKSAIWIEENYKDKNPIMVGVLKGALPFFGQLITNVSITLTTDFIVLSSYIGTCKQQTEPKLLMDLKFPAKDQHIILVEDVVDTGCSMKIMKEHLLKKGAASVAVICLADKQNNRKVKFDVDYSCFEVEKDKFIVGFGLDYEERLRNLPYIAEINKKIINLK